MSATASLNHAWFTKHASELASTDLTQTISNLKKWNARRKLKGAVKAVMLTNHVKNTISRLKS